MVTQNSFKEIPNKVRLTFSGKAIRVFFCILILVFPGFLHDSPGVAETLTIFHTNDSHSHLLPFDLSNFGKNIGGMAPRAEYLRNAEKTASNVLILDAGDIFQGTAFYSFFKGEVDLKAYSLCGYDAITLGNHDLDDGLANLQTQLQKVKIPMVCANVVASETGKLVLPPYVVFTRGSINIGVIGIIGEEAWNVISLKCRIGLNVTDPQIALSKVIRDLNDRVDLIVVLSHSGFGRDLELAEKVPGIDVIIGGHTNTFLEHPRLVKHTPTLVKADSHNRIGGTLVLQAFKWGIYVGRLDLLFDEKKDLIGFSGKLDAIDGGIRVPSDSEVLRLISAYEERIKSLTTQIVGKSTEPMTYPEDKRHRQDLPLGTFVCECIRDFVNADLAIVNSGTIRDEIPAGNITMGNIFSAFPFENSVVTMKIKGKDLDEMLQYIAGNYGQITGYQYSGAKFTIDLSQKRASDIQIGDRPLDPEKEYKLATISYLSDGNQHGNELFKSAYNMLDTGFSVRDVILDHVKRVGVVKPPDEGLLRFAP